MARVLRIFRLLRLAAALVAAAAATAAAAHELEPRLPPSPVLSQIEHARCSTVYCDIELCNPVEDCDGEVHENATDCGCCPLCIKYLDRGRACGRHGLLRFPERPTTMCRPPLLCVNGFCADPPPPPPSPPRRGVRPGPGPSRFVV